jgi:hypothetical protein
MHIQYILQSLKNVLDFMQVSPPCTQMSKVELTFDSIPTNATNLGTRPCCKCLPTWLRTKRVLIDQFLYIVHIGGILLKVRFVHKHI